MNASRLFIVLLSAFFVLAFAQPVLANVIAPTISVWPGMVHANFALAIPASILAAVLERPFLTRAGVSRHTMLFSLQANAVSLAIGYVTLPVGYTALYVIGPLWWIIAVGLSIVSEGWYCRVRATEGGQLRWRYIVCGNVFSSFVLLLLPFISMAIGRSNPKIWWPYESYLVVLAWAVTIVSAAVFVLSFYLPGWLRRKEAGAAAVES